LRELGARAYRSTVALARSEDSRRLVVGAALLMIAAAMALRGWALFRGWFYADDYVLLFHARDGLGHGYLFTPFNGHLMPGGRFLAWLVEVSGSLDWGLATTLTLLFQLVASIGALWMLVALFSARWAILAPLGLYLFSAASLPALMWWTASLNQISMQSAFFFGTACWVLYLRTRRWRWLGLTLASLSFGLVFDVKSLLILPVLLFLMLGYFASGSLLARIGVVLRRYWSAAVVTGAAAALYLGYYVLHVDQPFASPGIGAFSTTATTMLGTAFMSAAVGGPWEWNPVSPPNALAAPPTTAVHLAWLLIGFVVAYAFLRRRRTLRAWVLLGGYLAALLGLLVTSRVPAYGPNIGLEYRYLTDATCAVTLCAALVFLPLLGAVESSQPRAEPYLRQGLPAPAVAGVLAVVLGGSVVSSVRFADIWHSQNASDVYIHTLAKDLTRVGDVDLADEPVPRDIISPLSAPDNHLSHVTPLLSTRAHYPDATDQLVVVGTDGGLRRAFIEPGVTSQPGPKPGCGWAVDSRGIQIPLTARAFQFAWWLRVGYIASKDSPVTVTAGAAEVRTQVVRGLNSLYVRVTGSFASVRIDGLEADSRLCVDTIEVGQPVPGGTVE
jgi:hypothetical protein